MQVGDLLERARRSLDEASAALGPDLIDVIGRDGEATLEVEQVAGFKDAVEDLADLVDQIHSLVERLPEAAIEVDHDDARQGVLADLVEGILDPGRVLLAAQMLDAHAGCAAFAQSLRGNGAYVTWGETTLEDVLSRFQGADPSLAREIAARAGVTSELRFAEAGTGEVERVAVALERFAGG